MTTPYIAHVVNGTVESVQRADEDFVLANPELYVGTWVRVYDMNAYPAPGWGWGQDTGFTPPVYEDDNGE